VLHILHALMSIWARPAGNDSVVHH